MPPDYSQTYARLSLWTKPGQPASLTSAATAALTSVLSQYDLTRLKTTPAKPYLLFEAPSAAAVFATQNQLKANAAWQQALDDTQITTWSLRFHSGPAPGRSVLTGSGRLQGDWRTYSILDGLPSPSILDMVQDQHDRLWWLPIAAAFVALTAPNGPFMARPTVCPTTESK
jgi:hypothetical protein